MIDPQVFHQAGTAGIPWAVILQWLAQYALPIVLQVLEVILPLILSGKVSVADGIKWAESALVALASGQPMPALP